MSRANGSNNNHRLPRWFALRGPQPYFLAEHWSMILSIITAVTVFVNTLILGGLPTAQISEWINAAMAWVAAIGLYLKDRQPQINQVAAWREKIRAEEAEKAEDDGTDETPTD